MLFFAFGKNVFSQGNNYKLDGNNNGTPTSKIGFSNAADFKVITNDTVRLTVGKYGNTTFKGTLTADSINTTGGKLLVTDSVTIKTYVRMEDSVRILGPLHIGANSISINSSVVGGITTQDIIGTDNGALNFLNSNAAGGGDIKIGIGAGSTYFPPAERLHIISSNNAPSLIKFSNITNSTGILVGAMGSGYSGNFQVHNQEINKNIFLLTNGGGVGIGATSTSPPGPTERLDVDGNARVRGIPTLSGNATTNHSLVITNNTANAGTFNKIDFDGSTTKFLRGDGQWATASGGTTDHDWYEVGTTLPPDNINDNIYKSGGSVGIGTTLPTARLHLPAGGTAANSAPLKFTSSNSILTQPESGAMEYFNNSRLFFTVTPGSLIRNEIAQIAGTGTIPPNRTAYANNNGYLTSDINYWQWDGAHAKLYQPGPTLTGAVQIGNPTNLRPAIEIEVNNIITTGMGVAWSEGGNRATIHKVGSTSQQALSTDVNNITDPSYLKIENTTGGHLISGPNVILSASGNTGNAAVRLSGTGVIIGPNNGINNVATARLEVNGTVRMVLPQTNSSNLQIDPITGQVSRPSSTMQIKDSITDLVFNRDSFFMLKPRDFVYKPALGNRKDAGLIAEEVYQVMPKLAIMNYKHFYYSDGSPRLDTLGIPIIDSSLFVPEDVDYRKLTAFMLAIIKDYRDSLTLIKQLALTNNSLLNQRLDYFENRLNSCCTLDTTPSFRVTDQTGQMENYLAYSNNKGKQDFTTVASITLEHTYPINTVGYPYPLHAIQLHYSGSKYVAIQAKDLTPPKLVLYNLDHSIFKTISLPNQASDQYFNGIIYISEALFDTDSMVEYMFLMGGLNPWMKIYNEDGSILWEETECNPACELGWNSLYDTKGSVPFGPIFNSDNGSKMIIHSNVDVNNSGYNSTIKIYALPGSVIGNGLELYNGELPAQFKIYPNPSGNSSTIEYQLPQGESKGEIEITNLMGQVVKKITISNGQSAIGKMELDNTQLPAGTYFYQLQTGKGSVGVKKVIIIK